MRCRMMVLRTASAGASNLNKAGSENQRANDECSVPPAPASSNEILHRSVQAAGLIFLHGIP